MSKVVKVGPYEVQQFVSADEYVADTTLDEVVLNDAFLKQASLAAYYGTLLSEAQFQTAEFKLKRDVLSAKEAQALRENPPSDRKLTEKALEEMVTQNPKVQAVTLAYLRAQQVETMLKMAVDALRQKKDMIVQLGAAEREDAKGEIRMKVVDKATERGKSLKERLAAK